MSAIVVVELSLNGTDLFNDDGTRSVRIVKGHPGTPPVVRGSDARIPHLAGAVPRSRVFDYLDIELAIWQTAPEGQAIDDARAAFRQSMRALYALFTTVAITPAPLVALLEDGSTASIEVRVIPPVLTDETVPGLAADLNVALRSVDPTWSIADEGS